MRNSTPRRKGREGEKEWHAKTQGTRRREGVARQDAMGARVRRNSTQGRKDEMMKMKRFLQ